MLATYGSLVFFVVAAALVGQALFGLCGRREWSWLAPAVGLGLLSALAWGTVRLPGRETAALIAIGAVSIVALLYLRGRVSGVGGALRIGLPLALASAVAASLPFIVEGRFGILGTGLDPDMSQHLFAADHLLSGDSERLISSGYPLGPHSLVVAATALGPGLVQAFGGLTLAVAVIATLTPLAILDELPVWRRIVGALLVGFAYMVASYLIQGAFKETMEALFVLAFAIGLHELSGGRLTGRQRGRPSLGLALPLAALVVGSAYVYSFPGLLWLLGAAGLWAVAELTLAARDGGGSAAVDMAREAVPLAGAALAAAAILVAPEIGRMIDFANFETFDPTGAGLGNLFNPISPFEALGIWPSGDFRLDAGAGAVPTVGFYLGCALASVALVFGLWWWLRRREVAVPAAFGAAGILIAYAGLAGTPYQEAKAIAIAAAPAMLISARGLLATAVGAGDVERIMRRRGLAALFPRSARLARLRLAVVAVAVAFVAAAAGCSLLALANGPVGPTTYSPALTELRPFLGGSTLVLAPSSLLDAHGRDYLVWELRGGRVCVEPDTTSGGTHAPRGISQVITIDDPRPPYEDVTRDRERGGYTVWSAPLRSEPVGPCPLISPGARAEVAQNP
jgi:hypothetical protein